MAKARCTNGNTIPRWLQAERRLKEELRAAVRRADGLAAEVERLTSAHAAAEAQRAELAEKCAQREKRILEVRCSSIGDGPWHECVWADCRAQGCICTLEPRYPC